MDNFKLRISAVLFAAILCISYFTPSIASVANTKSDSVANSNSAKTKLTPTSNVGTLKGDFQVTPAGQAHYTIPIDVPPGTAKMQPALSIAYDSTSSNTHNGPLGMGFSIEGLTAITRCNSNKTLNGLIHGVDFTDQDRFCLNGEQLVAVKGAYGADGTEYRTYIDSKAKIVSYGRVGNGPAKFTVWTKGGQIATYGATPDSQIYAQGKPTIATWALTQITDTVGNYLTVRYLKDDPNGAFYPQTVNYTGNAPAHLAPYYSVEFNYEARPDVIRSYTAGSLVKIVQRLKTIQVKNINPAKVISSYNFTYEKSPNSYRSRITSIQKCGSDGVCLPPTKFTWQTNGEGWVPAPAQFYPHDYISYYGGGITRVSNNGADFVSFRGNGLADSVRSVIWNSTDKRNDTWMNTGNGWAKDPSPDYKLPDYLIFYGGGVPTGGNDNGARFVDLRGRGLPDFVRSVMWNSYYAVNDTWMNTGSGWEKTPNPDYKLPMPGYIEYYGGGESKIGDNGGRFVDLRGIGLPDYICSVAWNSSDVRDFTWMNTGSGWEKNPNPAYRLPDYVVYYGGGPGTVGDNGARFVDLLGNGLPDYIVSVLWNMSDIRNDIWWNTGSGWVKNTNPNYRLPDYISYYKGGPGTECDNGARFVDLLGDGHPDYIVSVAWDPVDRRNDTWINTGAGWLKDDSYRLPDYVSWYEGGAGTNGDNGARFIDLRGTGLPDFVRSVMWKQGDARDDVWMNTGNGWAKEHNPNYRIPDFISYYIGGVGTYGDNGVRFVDLLGTGLPDIVQSVYWTSSIQMIGAWLNKAQKYPDYLISITDGLGAKLDIDYEALSVKYRDGKQVNVYTKEHDAQYPNMDWQGPMYVVDKTTSFAAINDPKAIARVLANNPNSKNALDHVTTYHYTGAKFNHLGLGFLGFHKITSTDVTTGISTTTTYSQDINAHNQGSPIETEVHLSDAAQTLISNSHNTWDLKTYGDGKPNTTYYSPYVKESSKNSYTLAGKLISTETTVNTLDDFGNPTEIVANTKDFVNNETYRTTTENTYNNNPTNWFIGELTYAKVIKEGTNRLKQIRTSSFVYDPANSLLKTSIAEPDDLNYALTTDYERDSFGNVKTTTVSGKGITPRVTKAIYDPTGRFVTQTINPLNQSTYQYYDYVMGLINCSADLNGLETHYTYDGFGRLVTQYNPGEPLPIKTDISFNWVSSANAPNGTIANAIANSVYSVSTHTQDSTTQTNYYDQLGRKVATTTQSFDKKTIWQLFFYDELDRLTAQTLPFFEGSPIYKTEIQYDVLGRVTQTTFPDNSTTKVIYDGFKITTVNQLQQQQIKQTNALGQLVKTIDNLGSATTYQYDAYGNMTAMIDSANHHSDIVYDFLGRKTEIKDPDKGHWKYSYDILGQLTSQTDALGHITTFEYDPLGRMTVRKDPAGTSTWEYDTAANGIGKLAKINGVAGINGKNPDITVIHQARQAGLESYQKVFAYDKLSRPAQTINVINGIPYFSSQTYDADSRISVQTYPNGVRVQNIYNDLGFLVKLSDYNTKKDYWTLKATDAAGHITWETHSNGLNTTYTYDPKTSFLTDIDTSLGTGLTIQKELFPGTTGLTAKHEHLNPTKHINKNDNKINALQNNAIQNEKYTYDSLGNVQTHKDLVNAANDSYTYDNLNRIKTATGSTNETFEYDALGNITTKSDVGAYKYGENGAGPHAVTSITGVKPATFQYDANGDQISATIVGVTRKITYSSFSKPLSITTPTQTTNFYYNADRESFERIDQTSSKTVTTYYLGDYEIDSINDGKTITTEQKCYIGANTIYDVKKVNGKPDETNIYTTLHNSIGSLTDIADASGNILQHFTYTPFGEQKQTKGQILDNPITHHGFTGHEEIEGTNLIHMNGRIYDPVIGRFLSADPFVQAPDNSQSLNRYSYCLNNPLALTDPSGYGWLSKIFHNTIGRIFAGVLAGVITIAAIVICPVLAPLLPYAGWIGGAVAGATTTGIGLAEGLGWKQAFLEGAAAFGITYGLNASGLLSNSMNALKGSLGSAAASAASGGAGTNSDPGPSTDSDGGASTPEGQSFADKSLAAATTEAMPEPQLTPDDIAEIESDRVSSSAVIGSIEANSTSNSSNGAKTKANSEAHGASRLSPEGYEFLEGEEGFKDHVYYDQGGRGTIGYGHVVRPGEHFGTISQERALRILESDVARAESAVRNNISANLSQNQFDALTSFTFNLGGGTLQKSSLRDYINTGNFGAAANSFALFNKVRVDGGRYVVSQGLINRRKDEANLFRNGEY